jgi:predicted alpha/beta-fold hydrolase
LQSANGFHLDPYRQAWWLPGAHPQTCWGRFQREKQLVTMRREALITPDGDELLVDHLDSPASETAPRVILLHGLEGSSYSVYMQGMMALAARRGWLATAVNFRSCARPPEEITRMLPNHRPRMYHSGETTDMDFVFRTMKAREPQRPLAAVGVSLGGNALLKWLGEHPDERLLEAAASISVPYDLGAGSKHLETPVGRFYLKNFLKTLIPKAIRCAETFPEAAARIDVEGTRRSTTFWTFDDYATGPLHGFKNALDYYTRCSSIHFVGRIAAPTLCISAADDPFLPRRVLKEMDAVKSPAVRLLVTERGGHVGFVSGPRPKQARYWAEETAIDWLASVLQSAL